VAEITARWPAYRALIAAQWRGQTQYRASFLLDLSLSAVVSLLDVASVLVMFRLTPALGGFDVRAALLMAALAGCSFSLADLLVGNIERMRPRIRTGTFDTLLTRPLGVLPQALASDIGFRRIGRAVQGIVVLALATWYAQPPLNPTRILLLVVAPLSGTLFYAGVFVAGAYGLGFAFVAYYPALALLDRADPLGLPSWVGWCAPLVALAVFGAALRVWRTGVRHYRSTGS
jgi:ABC-2 type transport system permease protein